MFTLTRGLQCSERLLLVVFPQPHWPDPLLSPPPYHEHPHLPFRCLPLLLVATQRVGEASKDWPLDRTQEATQPYARAAAEAAQELGVPCLDLNTLLQQVRRGGGRWGGGGGGGGGRGPRPPPPAGGGGGGGGGAGRPPPRGGG